MRIIQREGEPTVQCQTCEKAATCYATYEGCPLEFACDECCGHGCEDGKCWPVTQERETRNARLTEIIEHHSALVMEARP